MEPGTAEYLYSELFDRGVRHGAEPFDLHVAASIAALAVREAEEDGVPLSERIGLDADGIRRLCSLMFPGGIEAFPHALEAEEQELVLRDILWMNSANASAFEVLLAHMIARRSQRPNHLWQDLGLAHRSELTELMSRHFPRLARRNRGDMKWKKFFYRTMCSAEQFRLCAAPVCTECDEFDDCFGSEDGEALLARIANGRTVSQEARA